MKAIQMNKFGASDVLYLAQIEEPLIDQEEVLVDIHAASINPADSKRRQGLYDNPRDFKFPYVLGRDFSGVITKCGQHVTDFSPGDKVYGVLPVGQEGTYQEKLAVHSKFVALKPDNMTHVEAASLALAGLTALVSIEDCIKLKKNERILIHGGAGGVGSFAVQLAQHIGAYTITTASRVNHEYLSLLGADEIIDYNTEDFSKIVSNVDAVFDLIGGDVHERSIPALKPLGRIAYIAPLNQENKSQRADIEIIRPDVQRDREHMHRIIELFTTKAINAPAIQSFSLTRAKEAHQLIDTNHVRGKLVLEMK